MSDAAVREPNLTATRDAPLGGQAVIEGVMMRGVRHWSVAVRKPLPEAEGTADVSADSDAPAATPTPAAAGMPTDTSTPAAATGPPALGPVAVYEFELPHRKRSRKLGRIPLLRGVIALGSSFTIGFRALTIAANAQVEEVADVEIGGGIWVAVMVVAFLFAIGLFFVLPLTVVSLVRHRLGSSVLFWLAEGALRTSILLVYLWLISRMRDLRRTFEYHGAEHKTISCYEAGDELTPARAALYSRFHPRCGTSFLLVVMIVSIFVFAIAGLHAWWVLVITRIVGIPIIVGISFELIRFAGRNRRLRWVRALMWPGIQLQRLTTREPSPDQLEVAIAALSAVLAHETPGDYDADELVGVEVVA